MTKPDRQVGVHLSEAEMRSVTGAEKTVFPSPIPTQVISNGEYNPLPQTCLLYTSPSPRDA